MSKDEVLPAFTKEIENKEFLHGPVAQKDCKGCHSSHGSEHFRLLIKEYPPEFYAPFSTEAYELCFSCHKESLALVEKTSELTDFRNGEMNLHYLHVNKPQRGRTCRSCHSTHASTQANHVRESVPYGMWDLPIQFEKTETGGSCTPGCHVAYRYDRESPVDYTSPAAAGASSRSEGREGDEGEPARESGKPGK
jgi:predicted CXXCH cytochrome family protein